MNYSEKIYKFALESNTIEGEGEPTDGQIRATDNATLKGIETLNNILNLHFLVAPTGVDWAGKLRTVSVRVGSYHPPEPAFLPSLMDEYIKKLPTLDSWTAHNEFEAIHPFQDFNGRVGRLIWLSKAVREGYSFSIPFLHKYYYQTLQHQQNP